MVIINLQPLMKSLIYIGSDEFLEDIIAISNSAPWIYRSSWNVNQPLLIGVPKAYSGVLVNPGSLSESIALSSRIAMISSKNLHGSLYN